ncbi:MAG: DNA mismatch repair endonuclease MutL [Phycisphaerae bacterium]|nr:DNA mismatch repair endonuclease MutL [Phycisphaerae bacterium]
MGRIHILPDLLVNKIAAGEVIERPASVLKELLENSVDAGATRIDVTLEDGGKRLLRVADDGCGMSVDDLALAVHPHATSKISHEDDLFHIATMGFRGEALASIGSVANLRIVSRTPDETAGHVIAVTGDQIDGPQPVAAAPGTAVEVRELFFNVPARRKFLRTTNTELGHVTEQLTRIALAHLHVHLTCKHNGRVRNDLAACGAPETSQALRRRIADLFSPELAEDLIAIDRPERGLRVWGWVAPPARTRGTASWQYTWLNGRFIRDRFVQHAIREAYRGLLPEGRFPVVFLFLEIDPGNVDVNVHPTKIEVRFRDSNLVHSQVLASLRETFLGRDLTPGIDRRALTDHDPASMPPVGGPTSAFGRPGGGHSPIGSTGRPASPGRPAPSPERQQEMRQALAEFLKNAPPTQRQPPDAPPPPLDPSRPRAPFAEPIGDDSPTPTSTHRPRRAMQFHNTYLVAESDDGLIIIDQHALHERIIYQQLVDRIGQGNLESQRLLLAETVNVTPTEMAVLDSFGELFQRLGLELVPFGPTSVAIQAVPSVLSDGDATDWVRQLLARLADKPDQAATDEFVHELLDMMACKAAVKAGDSLTPEEIEALLARRTDVEKASACPHGRPTTLRLTIRDLEKQFKRT